MTLPNLFHHDDPDAKSFKRDWSWVYLHGEAEQYNYVISKMLACDITSSPDIFVSDQPKPTSCGVSEAMLYGRKAIVIMYRAKGDTTLSGLIVLESDVDSLRECIKYSCLHSG